jgi:hypothetical protein
MDDPLAADLYSAASRAATSLTSRLSDQLRNPTIAAICGSGLGGLADSLHAEPRLEVPYGDIPSFPKSTGTIRCSLVVKLTARGLMITVSCGGCSAGPCGKACIWAVGGEQSEGCIDGGESAVSPLLLDHLLSKIRSCGSADG